MKNVPLFLILSAIVIVNAQNRIQIKDVIPKSIAGYFSLFKGYYSDENMEYNTFISPLLLKVFQNTFTNLEKKLKLDNININNVKYFNFKSFNLDEMDIKFLFKKFIPNFNYFPNKKEGLKVYIQKITLNNDDLPFKVSVSAFYVLSDIKKELKFFFMFQNLHQFLKMIFKIKF